MKHICELSPECKNQKCSHKHAHDVEEVDSGRGCDVRSYCPFAEQSVQCVNIDTMKRKKNMDEKCSGCLGASVAHTCKGGIKKEHLAEKHTGMKISADGLLGRIRDGWKVQAIQKYSAGEMLKHLEEMAKRFYAGDIKAVDEFLQLYCLDDDRPKETE